jgi:hypothetical protein
MKDHKLGFTIGANLTVALILLAGIFYGLSLLKEWFAK